MTLHWWQHWFWITGRAPVLAVLAVLVAVLGHVCGQQHDGGLYGDGVFLHVPVVEVRVPVVVPAWSPWSPWAPRRLLGFAGPPLGGETDPESTAVPVAEPGEHAEHATGSTPVAVTYLTVGSASQPGRARDPKAIGGPLTSTPTATVEIVEKVTPTPATSWSPDSESPSPSPTAESEAGTSGTDREMLNDDPAEAVPIESTVSPSSASPEAAFAPAPLNTSGSSAASAPSTTRSPEARPRPTLKAMSSTIPTTSLGPHLGPGVHPGLSTPQRPTPESGPGPAPAPTTGPTVGNVTTSGTVGASSTSGTSGTSGTAEEVHVHRSASTSQGAARQHRPGQGHLGPGAMSLSSGGGLDAGSITGIVLGIVVFAGLVGTVSFVLYRRRYLNKPQTLNDKCSNPDSSGYIDDSTLRENSEEMYSLDNDSFLNSLEAMTIQNYWTDTVKHTKL